MDAFSRVAAVYIRYVKGWLSMGDAEVANGRDIALLAFDAVNNKRYHIEVDVGRTGLDEKDEDALAQWLNARFNGAETNQALMQFGFSARSSARVMISRHASQEFRKACERANVELWIFSDIVMELRLALRNRMAATDQEGRFLQALFYPVKNAAPS